MQFEMLHRELADSAAVVRQLVTGVGQQDASHKPSPESWSILEVVCHLYDEEREDFRQRLDIALHRPQEPWPPIDPVGWVTRRQYNARDLAEMLGKFLAERDLSLAWLRDRASANWEAEYPAAFGPIRAGDLLASWVAHDNLHIRQLVELRRARLVAITAPYSVQYAGDW